MVVITPFGLTGPYAGYRAHHLVTFHAGGEGSILPERRGLEAVPRSAADPDRRRRRRVRRRVERGRRRARRVLRPARGPGAGQRIDVSVQESQLTLNRTRLSRFNNDGVALRREGSRYGFIGMMRVPRRMGAARRAHAGAVGRAGGVARRRRARRSADRDRGRPRRGHGRGRRGAARVVPGARQGRRRAHPDAARVPGRRVRHSRRICSRRRSSRTAAFFREVDDGRGGRAARARAARTGSRRHRSRCGRRPRSARRTGSRRAAPRSRALAAGPRPRGRAGARLHVGRGRARTRRCLLALLGAEVVKVESTRRPDPARRGFLADYGGINRSPNFNELNLGKRSFQVDLSAARRARARPPARRRGPTSSSTTSVPGVMARFGLDAAALLERRPDLLVVSSSANGSTGPDAMAAGLASIFGATGGLSEQTGYADGPPTEIGESTDYRSANALAVAILAALLHRARTGEGQHVDLASREVVAASAPDALLAAPARRRLGAPGRERAPRACARTTSTRAAGDDDWVAVAVGDDAEWARAVRGARSRPEWVQRVPHGRGRAWRAASAIDDAIAAWTRRRLAREAFERAPGRGRAGDGGDDERGAGDRPAPRRSRRLRRHRPPRDRSHARDARAVALLRPRRARSAHGPLIGQDNDYVLGTLLGLSPERARRARGGAPMTATEQATSASGSSAAATPDQVAALEARADRLAVGRRPHRVAQPEPRGDGGPRAAGRAHRAGADRHVDPAAAALSARRSSPSRSPISTAPPTGG